MYLSSALKYRVSFDLSKVNKCFHHSGKVLSGLFFVQEVVKMMLYSKQKNIGIKPMMAKLLIKLYREENVLRNKSFMY